MINKKISVVVPCRNEEENILPMYERLSRVLMKITSEWEIIYTDNCSTDNSEKVFNDLTQKDSRVSVILFSRDFGSSDVGYTAGSEYATGDAVVWIDGDIQDPPELIEQFAEKWQEGYDIIYGIRARRKGSIFKKIAYKIFYRVFKVMSYIDIPLNAGDFSLMDRKVIDVINSMPERNRFVRGLRAWAGFKSFGIEYTRADRERGVTQVNYETYFRFAKKGIFSFSYTPLEIITNITFVITGITAGAILFYLGWYFIASKPPAGYMTLLMMILFLGSAQLLAISVIGEYIGRIFEEVKQRPKYIIKKILNNHHKD